jgi:hypothetical protein
MRALVRFALILGLGLVPVPSEAQDKGPEVEALRKELENVRKQFETMKDGYEKAMNKLSERINTLESRPATVTAAPPPPGQPYVGNITQAQPGSGLPSLRDLAGGCEAVSLS